MPKFRVEKSLSKITRALEALIEAVESRQDLNIIRKPDEGFIHMFHD